MKARRNQEVRNHCEGKSLLERRFTQSLVASCPTSVSSNSDWAFFVRSLTRWHWVGKHVGSVKGRLPLCLFAIHHGAASWWKNGESKQKPLALTYTCLSQYVANFSSHRPFQEAYPIPQERTFFFFFLFSTFFYLYSPGKRISNVPIASRLQRTAPSFRCCALIWRHYARIWVSTLGSWLPRLRCQAAKGSSTLARAILGPLTLGPSWWIARRLATQKGTHPTTSLLLFIYVHASPNHLNTRGATFLW